MDSNLLRTTVVCLVVLLTVWFYVASEPLPLMVDGDGHPTLAPVLK